MHMYRLRAEKGVAVMGSSAKNYQPDGSTTVIGGVLNIVGAGQIQQDGEPVVLEGGPIPNGAVTRAKLATAVTGELDGKLTAEQAEAVPDSAAENVAGVVEDLNALLASLRSAGIVAEE